MNNSILPDISNEDALRAAILFLYSMGFSNNRIAGTLDVPVDVVERCISTMSAVDNSLLNVGRIRGAIAQEIIAIAMSAKRNYEESGLPAHGKLVVEAMRLLAEVTGARVMDSGGKLTEAQKRLLRALLPAKQDDKEGGDEFPEKP